MARKTESPFPPLVPYIYTCEWQSDDEDWASSLTVRLQTASGERVLPNDIELPAKTLTAGFGSLLPEWNSSELPPGDGLSTLCLTNVEGHGAPYLLESIEHHLDLGFTRIVIGLDTPRREEDIAVFKETGQLPGWFAEVRKELAAHIEAGRVTFMAPYWPGSGLLCGKDWTKLLHSVSCLQYAKSTTENIAVWDVDEFLVPASGGDVSLPDILGEPHFPKENGDCHSTCFATFGSYLVFSPHVAYPDLPPVPRAGFAALDFPYRAWDQNFVYQKSIARSKAAHAGWLHIPGSCRMDEYEQLWHANPHKEKGNHDCGVLVPPAVASIHHFRHLIGDRESDRRGEDKLAVSEYRTHRWPRVAARIRSRMDEHFHRWNLDTIYRPGADQIMCIPHKGCN